MVLYFVVAMSVLVVIALFLLVGIKISNTRHNENTNYKNPGEDVSRKDNKPSDELIMEHLRKKNTIQAIKAYRELYHTDLKTAKEKIEEMISKYRKS